MTLGTNNQLIVQLRQRYDVPDAHVNDPSLRSSRCPECLGPGRWRRGVHFEHQKICFCGTPHSTVWCPDDIELFREALARELLNCNGDGI